MAAQVIVGILAALLAMAAVALASAAFRSEPPDWGVLGVSAVPALLAVVFGACSILLGAVRRKEAALAERRALNPDQPWLWADEWREGRIRSARVGRQATVLAAFALMWNTVVGGVALVVYRRDDLWTSPGARLTVLAFGLAGLALIAGTVYLVLLARKYSPAVFEMSGMPGVLGGHLRGAVHIPPQVPAGTDTRVTLSCDRLGTGADQKSTWCLWRDEVTARTSASGSLPVAFTIPFDLPPSELPDRASRPTNSLIRWSLAVAADVPGVDYSASFDVPVFATEASDRSIVAGTLDPSARTDRPPHAKSCVVESGPGRTVFGLGPAKGLGCGVSAPLLLPLLAWPIARLAGFGPIDALIVCGFALLAGVGILALFGLGVLVTATSIEIDRVAVRVPHGRWPLCWTRTIPLGDITEIRYASTESQRVDALTRAGRSYWISGDMSGPEEAKWLAAEVMRAIERYRP